MHSMHGMQASTRFHTSPLLVHTQDREPHLHTVVDAAAVHKLRDKLTQLQKDVQKFRTYLVRSLGGWVTKLCDKLTQQLQRDVQNFRTYLVGLLSM